MFEVKDAASLDKALNGLGDAVEKIKGSLQEYDTRLSEANGSMAELKSIVTDTQKQVEDSLRRHLPEKASQLLIDTDLEGALSWDAVHKAYRPVVQKTGGSRFEFDKADNDDLVGKFHDVCDQLYILAASMKAIDGQGRIRWEEVRQTKFYQGKYLPLKIKVQGVMEKDGFQTGGSTGSGNDWDPTSFSGRFFEKARVPLQVENLIPSFVMPRSPFLFPVEVGDLTSYLVAEISTAPPILGSTSGYIPDGKGSTAITSSKTFTAKKHALMAFVSKEAEEDLIVPILPYLEGKVIQAINIGKENAILNGDTAGTHMDLDVTSATDVRKSFDGLRDYALNVASSGTKDAGGANINTDALWRDNVRGARKLMADAYKGNNANIALIVSGNTAIDVGSCESFRTAYAMGGMGTNRIGDSTGFSPDGLGAFVVSEYIRSDVSSTGKNTATPASDVYTTAIQFYREAWLMGNERNVRLEVLRERFAEYDVDAVKVTWRGDLKAMLSGNHTVATININAS